VKYLFGNDCITLYSMATTLYTYIREGHVNGCGNIIRSGILMLDIEQVMDFLLSFHFVGNGTDADKMNTAIEFLTFLGFDVWKDCITFSDFEYDFWYIWASDGQQGFLLDMIKRPESLELRLEIYDQSNDPIVLKEFLPLNEFSQNGSIISMGPLTISDSSCHGSVDQNVTVGISILFSLDGRHMNFVPNWIENKTYGLVPDFQSNYGSLSSATVGSVTLSNVPLVYSTYPIKFGIQLLVWNLISANQFQGTDLQIEIVGMNIEGLWIATSYLRYQGKEWHLNDPMLFDTSIVTPGEIVNDTRLFAATIDTLEISVGIKCQAPVNQFALLDKEGLTIIETTVFGICTAQVDTFRSQEIYTSSPTSLLETKYVLNN